MNKSELISAAAEKSGLAKSGKKRI